MGLLKMSPGSAVFTYSADGCWEAVPVAALAAQYSSLCR
jgi:hypothetical protein